LKRDLLQNAQDLLAIKLFTRKVAWQKLNYLHQNPVAKKWKLATN
jgi:hypothetical protein